ncbi:MAG: hypothetical protein WAJ85_01595 [Candidatus Baltobacteraceae bacterium]
MHGLGDNSEACWSSNGQLRDFWPAWIAEAFADTDVWLVDYPAAKFWFGNGAMSLEDRASSFLHNLVDRGFGERPIAFITHSLGGLVVKQALQLGFESRLPAGRAFAEQTRAVAFIATPHSGSAVANAAIALGLASNATRDLSANNPALERLREWYRGCAPTARIVTRSFYETKKLRNTIVVTKASANPNVPDSMHTPVDADHLSICKPSSKEDPVYIGICAMLETIGGKTPPTSGAWEARAEWSQKHRTEKAEELFGLIVGLKAAWSQHGKLLEGTDVARLQRAEAGFTKAFTAFRDAYPKVAVLFGDPIAQKLRQLDALIGGPNTALPDDRGCGQPFTLDPPDASAVDRLISSLLRDFRGLTDSPRGKESRSRLKEDRFPPDPPQRDR